MKSLRRNQRDFYYALYEGIIPVSQTDEEGNSFDTGEYVVKYGDPTLCQANVSPASGAAVVELFGTEGGFDKVLVFDDPDTPIDDHSVLWLEAAPSAPYDYVVRRVARGLHNVAIAVSKVNVSE